MKKGLLSIILISIVIIIESCHFGTSGTWKNDRIDEGIKAKIESLNNKLFKSIMNKDIAGVKQLMSKKLIDAAGSKLDTIITSMGGFFHATEYRVLDEYYTKNSTVNNANTIFSGIGGHNDYKIQYLALNEEMYASLLVSKNQPINCLILAIYGKYDDEWKLNILQIGEYDILNKTGPDYYDVAVNEYNKGNLVIAANIISMVPQLASPATTYFRYDNEDKMKDFYTKVLKEANDKYHLPLVLDAIKTKPQVFAITPQLITDKGHEGIYPAVRYKTNITITDTIALKTENNAMQKVIGITFKGIDQDNSNILYEATDQIPDNKTEIKRYRFNQKIR